MPLTSADEPQDAVPMRQDRGPDASRSVCAMLRFFGGSWQ
jgi:hypothetical protein